MKQAPVYRAQEKSAASFKLIKMLWCRHTVISLWRQGTEAKGTKEVLTSADAISSLHLLCYLEHNGKSNWQTYSWPLYLTVCVNASIVDPKGRFFYRWRQEKGVYMVFACGLALWALTLACVWLLIEPKKWFRSCWNTVGIAFFPHKQIPKAAWDTLGILPGFLLALQKDPGGLL